MDLFSIHCLTCHARLKVRDPAAIGRILACPKCGSMVQVLAPPGWQPDPVAVPPAGAALTISHSGVLGAGVNGADATTIAPALSTEAADAPTDAPVSAAAGEAPAAVSFWHARAPWLAAGGGGVVVVALSVAGWLTFGRGEPDMLPLEPLATVATAVTEPLPTATPEGEAAVPEAAPPVEIDARWVPAEARLVVTLQPAAIARAGDESQVAAWAGSAWQEVVLPLAESFGLAPDGIARLTWAVEDASRWRESAVVMIHLEQPLEDDSALVAGCERLDLRLEDAVCHRRTDGPWRQPFAVLDETRIVTGPEELLRGLASPPSEAAGTPVRRLLAQADAAALTCVVADVAALRVADPDWELPWGEDWQAGRNAWGLVRDIADGLSVSVGVASPPRGEVRLLCSGESSAERLHAGLEAFCAEAEQALAADADPLLAATLQAVRDRQSGVEGQTVWFRATWKADPALLASGIDLAALIASADMSLSEPTPEVPSTEGPLVAAGEEQAVAAVGTEPDEPTPTVAPRPALAPVDVAARLAEKLPRFACREMPLATFLELFARLARSPITIDLDGLAQSQATLDTPVTLEVANTTNGEALDAALVKCGLGYGIDGSHVIVGDFRPERQSPISERHDVADLAAGDAARTAELARLVQLVVAPDTWLHVGGQGRLHEEGNTLAVEQPPGVQWQVGRLLAKLRLARGLSGRDDTSSPPVVLATPRQLAQARLATPLSATFAQPTPLSAVLDHLERSGQARIVVDWRALAELDLAAHSTVTLQSREGTLADALATLTGPLDLAVRAVDAGTLELLSRRAAATRHEVEVYPAADLAAQFAGGEALAATLQGELAWPEDASVGLLAFDRGSSSLVVRAPQEQQGRLEALLDDWRRVRPADASSAALP